MHSTLHYFLHSVTEGLEVTIISTYSSPSLSLSLYRFPSVMEGGTAFSGMDGKIVQGFQKRFVQVQTLLDQNRLLIDEINRNQESKKPDRLSRNVGLIRELNNNIRRVVDLYAHLSTSCTNKPNSPEGGSAFDRSALKRHRPV